MAICFSRLERLSKSLDSGFHFDEVAADVNRWRLGNRDGALRMIRLTYLNTHEQGSEVDTWMMDGDAEEKKSTDDIVREMQERCEKDASRIGGTQKYVLLPYFGKSPHPGGRFPITMDAIIVAPNPGHGLVPGTERAMLSQSHHMIDRLLLALEKKDQFTSGLVSRTMQNMETRISVIEARETAKDQASITAWDLYWKMREKEIVNSDERAFQQMKWDAAKRLLAKGETVLTSIAAGGTHSPAVLLEAMVTSIKQKSKEEIAAICEAMLKMFPGEDSLPFMQFFNKILDEKDKEEAANEAAKKATSNGAHAPPSPPSPPGAA